MSNNNILGALSSLIVRNPSGSIQWTETLAAVRTQVEKEMRANQESDRKIETALDSLYNSLPAGTGLPTPTVVQTVAASLSGGNMVDQIRLVNEVEAFLTRTNRFLSKRGRSGGLFRVG